MNLDFEFDFVARTLKDLAAVLDKDLAAWRAQITIDDKIGMLRKTIARSGLVTLRVQAFENREHLLDLVRLVIEAVKPLAGEVHFSDNQVHMTPPITAWIFYEPKEVHHEQEKNTHPR